MVDKLLFGDIDFWSLMNGLVFEVMHVNAAGEVLWAECSHNQLTNEGLENIWDVYFKADTAPSGFLMALYTNAAGTLTRASVAADLTENSGNGYARQTVERSGTGWPNEGVEGSPPQRYIESSEETFTASGGAWSTVYGAAIIADLATDRLVCFDDFSAGRTLGDGDSLKVKVKVRRKDP